MKKILKSLLIVALLFVCVGVQAQPNQRKASTIVGDALAKFPAKDMKLYNELATELLGTGQEGMDLLYNMLEKQDDSMVPVEFALSAITTKASEVGGETLENVKKAFKGYADKTKDETIKQLFVRQLLFLGENYDGKNVTTSSELDPGTTPEPKVKDIVKSLKKGVDNVTLFDMLNKVKDVAAAKEAIVTALPKVKSNDNKADLLWWLGEQKDKALSKTFKSYLSDPDARIRKEAAWALTKSGCGCALPAMAKMLTSSDEGDVAVAEQCLRCLPGKVADVVAPYYDKAGAAGKAAILNLIGQRESEINKDLVMGSLFDDAKGVGDAAFAALPAVAEREDLQTLFSLLESSSEDNRAKIQDAILAAMEGMTDAEKLEVLTNRNNIVTPLSRTYYWPMILKVANISQVAGFINKNAGDKAFVEMAVPQYIVKVETLGEPGPQRLLRYREIMDNVWKDEQKGLILDCIGNTGAFQGIMFAAKYLDNKATEVPAANAIRKIATSNPNYYGPQIIEVMNRIKGVDTGRDYPYDLQRIENYLAAAPKDDPGYVSMFNGKDLTGWQGMIPTNEWGEGNPYLRYKLSPKQLAAAQAKADKVMAENWVVENGNIEFVGHAYDNLCTTKKYKDFEMYLDWKIYPGQREGDAGIYLRSCPQVQIWDTARVWVGAQVGSGGLYNNQKTERIPLVIADNAVGEWNSFYIKMQGERVTVLLNGRLVVDNIVLENYWDRSLPIPVEEFIELQAHGSRIAYRDLYIHELPSQEPSKLTPEEEAEGFEMLFDGTSLHKWHGNKVDYNVKDGVIAVESRSRGGSWIGDLYTNDEYADFIFRFEFKLTPGANNGVGVRSPGEGDSAYVGYEVQILDHYNDIYKGWLAPYQYHGSLYGIIPAKNRDALKPVGEWNSEEIYMKGSYIRVTVNGQVVTEGDIVEASKNGTIDGNEHPGLKRTSGYIGFLGHGDRLWIRNVRVKRL
ncbi:MAG: DUF1080 domain-containing protein [Bacteroidales bacterium]|nr:DUF1080 domain-containing protein [Bacteroidales bacterium]